MDSSAAGIFGNGKQKFLVKLQTEILPCLDLQLGAFLKNLLFIKTLQIHMHTHTPFDLHTKQSKESRLQSVAADRKTDFQDHTGHKPVLRSVGLLRPFPKTSFSGPRDAGPASQGYDRPGCPVSP